MIATLSCIAVVPGFLIFAWNYEIPLPFDEYRMSVEVYPAVVLKGENGQISWKEADFSDSKRRVPEDYDKVIDMVRISYKGLFRITTTSIGRNIRRDGEADVLDETEETIAKWLGLVTA